MNRKQLFILLVVLAAFGGFSCGAGIYEFIAAPAHAQNGQIDYLSPVVHIIMGLFFLIIAVITIRKNRAKLP